MSIRLRMTLLYSVILALTLIAFSGILYATQARQTMDIVKNDLVMSANRIIPLLIYAERSLDRARPAMPGIAMPPRLELREVRTRDTVRLLDADGTPFDLPINEGSEELPLSQKGLARLRDGKPWIEIAHSQEGRVLTYDLPVVRDGEVVAIIQVGRSLADRDRSLQALGLTLILGSLLTALVAFGAGWLLAGVTLRPIQRITQTALEIGQTRDFSSRVPYRGPNDELGRLATTFNGMLARLADAYGRVTHALQVQRDFVADVSHELRTPLTTIRGNLALLHREPPIPGAEQEDILGDLIGESERLIRLVNDLLILARADAGRKLQCEPVAVGPLVDDVCRQAQLLEPGREIACDGSGDAVALADRDALKQVLLILLDNAVQHTRGAIRVDVRVHANTFAANAFADSPGEQGRQVTISVQDSGPGISPELYERVFDRFYRGDASRSTPGFGLGLSIARALVEAQQGTITVESQVGQGSTFTVCIPKPAQP